MEMLYGCQAESADSLKFKGIVLECCFCVVCNCVCVRGSGHQPQPHTGEFYSPTHPSQPAAALSPSHVQHIYPRPGTPEAVRKATPGIGGDLAAIIAAKAASRKPIVTSPTRREFPAEDERFTRSMTVGGESSILEAR